MASSELLQNRREEQCEQLRCTSLPTFFNAIASAPREMIFAKFSTARFSKKYGDTDFITGIRAFAVLAVVLIHAGGAGLRDFGLVGNNIADFGAAGVYVFFVISGFSVASSYESSKGYWDYINKRLWRVAPLYYLWLVASISIGVTATAWQKEFGVEINAYNLLLHIFFLSFADYRVANSILGVEWSIPIEVFWYFAAPIFLVVCRSRAKTLSVLIASLLVYRIASKFPTIFLLVDKRNASLAMHWSPIPYIFDYAIGMASYRYRGLFKRSNAVGNLVFVLLVLLVVGYFYAPGIITKVFHDDFLFVSLLTAVLIIFGTGEAFFFGLLTNPVAQFLGGVSYGIYLCHYPLLALLDRFDSPFLNNLTLRFFLVVILSALLSAFTYYFFERRFVLIGKRFGEHMAAWPILWRFRKSLTHARRSQVDRGELGHRLIATSKASEEAGHIS